MVLTVASVAVADDPELEMAIDMSAENFGIALYEVKTADEIDFLEAVTSTGGYVSDQPGFAVEKVVKNGQGSPDGVTTFWVLTRHFNTRAMNATQEKREDAVAPYVASRPKFAHTIVSEHQVADWGLERGSEVEFVRTLPEPDQGVFDEYGTSLAFFKYGYTGQSAVLRSYPANTDIESVRQDLLRHDGLSGVTIARAVGDGKIIAYGEFFSTPAKKIDRSEIGTVLLNYRER